MNPLNLITTNDLFKPKFRKVEVQSACGQSSLADFKQIDGFGSFSYKTRANRFIIWRSRDANLYLEEHCLSTDLENNAVAFNFTNTVILPNATQIFETLDHTVILVTTVSSVHRIVLPHPKSLTDKGSKASLFADIGNAIISESKNFCSLNFSPTCATACLSAGEEAIFALGKLDGSILLITLPNLDEYGPPAQDIFHFSSTIKRLFSGLVNFGSSASSVAPPFSANCQSNDAGSFKEKPVSLCLELLIDDLRLHSLHADCKLRSWSCKRKELLTTFDLVPKFLNQQGESLADVGFHSEKWSLKSILTANTSTDSNCLMLYLCSDQESKFIFLVYDNNSVNKYSILQSTEAFAEAELVDFQYLNDHLLTIWRLDEGDSIFSTQLKYTPIDLQNWNRSCPWFSKNLILLDDFSFETTIDDDPADKVRAVIDRFMDYVFRPALFSEETILKATKICCKGLKVKSELGNEASSLKSQLTKYLSKHISIERNSEESGVFRILENLKSCLLQYNEVSSKIYGFFVVSDDFYGLISQDRITFLPIVDKEVCCSLHGQSCRSYNLCHHEFHNNHATRCLNFIHEFFEANHCANAIQFNHTMLNNASFSSNSNIDQLMNKFSSYLISTKKEAAFKLWSSKFEKSFLINSQTCLQFMQPNFDEFLELCRSVNDNTQIGCSYDESIFSRKNVGGLLPQLLRSSIKIRAAVCRDLIFLFNYIYRYRGPVHLSDEMYNRIQNEFLSALNILYRFYAILHWLMNLQQNSPIEKSDQTINFDISTMYNSSLAKLSLMEDNTKKEFTDHYLMDDFFGSQFHQLLNRYLRGTNEKTTSSFRQICAKTINISLSYIWPAGVSLDLFDFLLNNSQYKTAIQLCDYLDVFCREMRFVRHFMRGQALLQLDLAAEALVAFRQAYGGLEDDHKDAHLLSRLGFENMSSEEYQIQFYLKIAEMFEQRGFDEQVIELCQDGLQNQCQNENGQRHLLWTMLFKHYLATSQFERAFLSLQHNPNSSSRKTCLRLFVVRLLETKNHTTLIAFDYGAFEDEFIDILENRARNADIQQENVYSVLALYSVKLRNFEKAANYYYELANRLKVETSVNQEILDQRLKALSFCVQNLSLVESKFAFITTTTDADQNEDRGDQGNKSPKRTADDEQIDNVRTKRSRILYLSDLKREFLLSQCLSIIGRQQKVYSYLSVEETVSKLNNIKRYDLACSLSLAYDLKLETVFDSLTFSCILVSVCSKSNLDQNQNNAKEFDWLDENKLFLKFTPSPCHSTLAELSWQILQSFLEHFSTIYSAPRLYASVCRRLLSYGQILPAWFSQQYKKIDMPEYLRILMEYDFLNEAADCLRLYIESLLFNISPEEFNLQNRLPVEKSPVWLPYSCLDNLLYLYDKREDISKESKSKSDLLQRLQEYFKFLSTVQCTKIRT